MSKNKKPKAAKKAATPKSGLVVKSNSGGANHAKQSAMIPSSASVSSSKKVGAQNSAPRKAQ